jgi:hypothetical protein
MSGCTDSAVLQPHKNAWFAVLPVKYGAAPHCMSGAARTRPQATDPRGETDLRELLDLCGRYQFNTKKSG